MANVEKKVNEVEILMTVLHHRIIMLYSGVLILFFANLQAAPGITVQQFQLGSLVFDGNDASIEGDLAVEGRAVFNDSVELVGGGHLTVTGTTNCWDTITTRDIHITGSQLGNSYVWGDAHITGSVRMHGQVSILSVVTQDQGHIFAPNTRVATINPDTGLLGYHSALLATSDGITTAVEGLLSNDVSFAARVNVGDDLTVTDSATVLGQLQVGGLLTASDVHITGSHLGNTYFYGDAIITGSATVSGLALFTANVQMPGALDAQAQSDPTVNVLTINRTTGQIGYHAGTIGGGGGGSVTSDANFNTVAGTNAGDSITAGGAGGFRNTVFGYDTGTSITTGDDNTAFGSEALKNITGNNNVAVGSKAMGNGSGVGASNVAVGHWSLISATGGAFNTALGYGTLSNVSTGNFNIAIGATAGGSLNSGDSSNILIGNSGSGGDINVIRIGTNGSGSGQQNKCYIAGINGVDVGASAGEPVLISASGQLGTTETSSREFKKDIKRLKDEPELFEKLLKLNPVSFKYKNDANQITKYGLIAEEVAEIFPEFVIYKDGKVHGLRYNDFNRMLIYAFQELYNITERQQDRLQEMHYEQEVLKRVTQEELTQQKEKTRLLEEKLIKMLEEFDRYTQLDQVLNKLDVNRLEKMYLMVDKMAEEQKVVV